MRRGTDRGESESGRGEVVGFFCQHREGDGNQWEQLSNSFIEAVL